LSQLFIAVVYMRRFIDCVVQASAARWPVIHTLWQ